MYLLIILKMHDTIFHKKKKGKEKKNYALLEE